MSSATLEIERRDTLDYVCRLTWKEIYVDFRKLKSWQGLILWLDIGRGYGSASNFNTMMYFENPPVEERNTVDGNTRAPHERLRQFSVRLLSGDMTVVVTLNRNRITEFHRR
jgi:hypothetical protein